MASKHKLIPSVYLLINPSNTNESLRSGKMRIFIRPEYFLGTSSETHMVDLMMITKEEPFREFTHHEGSVKPIWCLLTDGGPDENPRFLANILKYLLIFKELDLDYLTVRTHAPGQSAYNPVERSMASLSGKLAGIVLNAFNYGKHLSNVNGQTAVVDEELGRKNFKHAGEHLCELWNRDCINEQPVVATYVERHDDTIFSNIEEETWDWIDRHSQICKYSLDLRKCEDKSCCKPPRAPEAFELLSLSNGFLPPIVQGQDKHFLNLVHTLEYFSDRLPGYDEHCLSISCELYHELVCQKCGKYFPTKTFMKRHVKIMHSSKKGQEKNDNQSLSRRENIVQEKNDAQRSNRKKNIVQEAHSSSTRENIVQEQNNREMENYDITPVGNYDMNRADQSIGQTNINENNEKNKITKGNRCNKREKGIAKSSQPWEQDHLTFQA